MAGSYLHVTRADGTYRGVDLLDHMGDAEECIEEMWAMIDYLTGGDKHKVHEAYVEGYFKKNCPIENLPLVSFESFWAPDEEEEER